MGSKMPIKNGNQIDANYMFWNLFLFEMLSPFWGNAKVSRA